MKTNIEKPLPCPFCGSNYIVDKKVFGEEYDSNFFGCDNCGAGFNDGEIDDWNRRAKIKKPKIDIEKIKEELCSYDKRNPHYVELWDPDQEPVRHSPCSCDSCFYGTDKLAKIILELLEEK